MREIEMSSPSNWRHSLGAVDRYKNIEKLKQSIAAKGLSSTGNARKTAVQAELDAYNTLVSREAYDTMCNAVTDTPSGIELELPIPDSPGITIGNYKNCHHIASGLVSEVYRSDAVALKVITETYNVEPHSPTREVQILKQLSHDSIVKLITTFNDSSGQLVLIFSYMPLTLAKLLVSGNIFFNVTRHCFRSLFSALAYLHSQGIIHRDIKPSNLLLSNPPTGPVQLSDFGTTWHPTLSLASEPPNSKILDVGTTCYRSPESLFANRSYNTKLDMWAAGTMLAECVRKPPKELFESRETNEDGNQLGLLLSIFKTIGTPTKGTWPEAEAFPTPPFEWYRDFEGKKWEELLPDADEEARDLVGKLVRYEGGWRLSAVEALEHPFFKP